jgi:hypothetical protein
MLNIYELVMNSEKNPLRDLPPAFRFQVMTLLSVMWTTIFCATAGVWFLYGALMVGHVLAIIGLFITASTFAAARTGHLRPATYRDYPAADGTSRYDDVWGA